MSEITSGDMQILRGYRSDNSRRILTPRALFISVEEREEVFGGQLVIPPIQDSQTLGIYALGVSGSSGSHVDTERHMTIDFGTTPGSADVGQARLRGAATTVLTVSETAPAALPVQSGDYFSVKRSWRPWLVLPRGVASAFGTPYVNQITMYTDYDIPYNDHNNKFTPKANITRSDTLPYAPKPSGFVDGYKTISQQDYRTVILSSVFSFCLGDTIAEVEWDVRDGNITVGDENTDTITVQFPVGFRWIKLTVLSNTGGRTGVMYFPIWVHDQTYMPLTHFEKIRDYSGDWREIEVEFFQQNTSDLNIPKGSAICCWEHDPFWGESIPDQYRDQFLGWNKEDVSLFRKHDPRNTVSISGLAEWLNRYRPIPMRVYDPLQQTRNWFEMQNIHNDKLAFYLLENFSTATVIGNLFLSGNTNRLKSLDLTGNSLFGQVQYAVLGYQGAARCDSLNSFWIRKRYPYMDPSERASVDRIMSLDQQDRSDDNPLKLSRRRWFAVASVLGAGGSFDGSTQTIYNSRAPGRTPLDSNSEQDAPGINLPSTDAQTVLNWLTGQHLEVVNNSNDSVPYPVIPNLDCVEVAWEEPILISDIDPNTGLVISNKEFLVKETNISYQDGEKKVEHILTEVTMGSPGQTVEVVEDSTVPADYEPPQDIPTPPIQSPTIPSYSGDLLPAQGIVFDAAGAHCSIFTGFDPVGSSLNYINVSTGLGGSNIWSCSDPYNYWRYFALQTDGLYRNDDPFNGGSWTKIKTNAELFGDNSRIGKLIHGSINRKGYFFIMSGNVFIYTTNYWTTVNRVAITGSESYQTALDINGTASVAISHFNNPGASNQGWLYAWIYTGSGNHSVYKSENWGESWSLIASGVSGGSNFSGHVPYKRSGGADNINDSDQWVYSQSSGFAAFRLKRSVTAGVSWSDQFAAAHSTTSNVGGAVAGHSIQTFTYNGEVVLSALYPVAGIGKDNFGGRISNDAGVSSAYVNRITNPGTEFTQNGGSNCNGYPVHSKSMLYWNRGIGTGLTNPILHRIYWTIDAVNTFSADTPSNFSGNRFASYVEWNIAPLVYGI